MLSNLAPVKESDIDGLIVWFQGILCLHHWTVMHKVVDDSKISKNSLMEIRSTPDRQRATIYIRNSLMGKPTNEFAPLLLHEMLHIVLGPIIEEHALQLKYELAPSRYEEYRNRLVSALERSIEHLAINISKLLMDPLEALREMEGNVKSTNNTSS